jgi:hypothetical protein
MAAMRDRMSALIKQGVSREQAGDQLKVDDFGWTQGALFKSSMPMLYDEMASKK